MPYCIVMKIGCYSSVDEKFKIGSNLHISHVVIKTFGAECLKNTENPKMKTGSCRAKKFLHLSFIAYRI